MGLLEAIRDGVKAGFSALGNLRESITYERRTSPAYNVTTGAVTATAANTSCTAVIGRYDVEEIDAGAVLDTDAKALVERSQLAFEPVVGHIIVRADATRWRIESVKTDPATAVWVLQLRKPGKAA